MRHFILIVVAIGWITASIETASAAETDLFGDELPTHAVARIGSIRPETDGPVDAVRPESLREIAFTPDGTALVTRGEPGDPKAQRSVHLWDATTGRLLRTFVAGSEPLRSLAVSADGRFVAAAASEPDGFAYLWDASTGRKLLRVDGGRGRVTFSPDGGRVATLARYHKRDMVRDYSTAGGAESGRFPIDAGYRSEFTDDGGGVLSIRRQGSTELRLYDVRTGKERVRLAGASRQPTVFRISPNGRTAAAADDDEVLVWEVASGREVYRLKGRDGRVMALAFSPDGRWLATAGADKTVRVWEVAAGEETLRFDGHRGPVTAVAFAPGGGRLASGGFDRTALVWNLSGLLETSLPRARPTADEFDDVWKHLASASPKAAYRAVGRIDVAGEAGAVFLRDRLRTILIPERDRKAYIARLIQDLDAQDSVVRHRATVELKKLRQSAETMLLRTADTTTSAEVKYRIRRILRSNKSRFNEDDYRRMRRIAWASELNAGPTAREALEIIVEGFPEPSVVAEAVRSLNELRNGTGVH